MEQTFKEQFENLYQGRLVQSTQQRDKSIYIAKEFPWSNNKPLVYCVNADRPESEVNWTFTSLKLVQKQEQLF